MTGGGTAAVGADKRREGPELQATPILYTLLQAAKSDSEGYRVPHPHPTLPLAILLVLVMAETAKCIEAFEGCFVMRSWGSSA